MTASLTPRQMAKRLLQGDRLPRPLFLPIVFTLGARVENVPLRAFLGNATKVSNSLRHIRSHLQSDGVACYFDPYLETEALGGQLQWEKDNLPPSVLWPGSSGRGALPQGLRDPEVAVRSGRVGVAAEVIRRLKSLLRDDSLLMAGVAGPFTLAARLAGLEREDGMNVDDLPDDALELAASTMQQMSSVLAEAGANVVFIQESILPVLSPESCERWAFLLGPAINIIRFYEALPLLQLTDTRTFAGNSAMILDRSWDCVLCPALDEVSLQLLQAKRDREGAALGVSLPLNTISAEDQRSGGVGRFLDGILAGLRPTIVTTAGDVPATIEMKHLIKVGEHVRRFPASCASGGAGS